MASAMYALIGTGLVGALLIAMLAPPPPHPVDLEPQLSTGLLVAASVAVLLMGSFALSDHHAAGIFCGAAAWLIVVPCLWLARAPEAAGAWGDEDDDDDGGSPQPDAPFGPPAPDGGLPPLDPPARSGALGGWSPAPAALAWSPAPATAEAPLPAWAMRQGSPAWAMAQVQASAAGPQFAGAAEDLYEELPITDPVWEPVPVTAPACEQSEAPVGRLPRGSAPRLRGEHRSVGHRHARAGAHPARRRRAGLPRRVLQACRRWLGVQSPECRRRGRLDAIEHGGRRRGSRMRSRTDRRDAVAR